MLHRDAERFSAAAARGLGDAARLRGPRRASTGSSTATGSPPSSDSDASRRTRWTRSPTGTSRSTTSPRPHLRDSPVPDRRRDRALVEHRVRLLPAGRGVLLGLLDHAAEDEPGRGRAAAGQGAARGRLPTRPCSASSTRCRSPTARTCRRTRSRSSMPSTRSSSACGRSSGMLGGISLRSRADGRGRRRRDGRRDRHRRPAGPPRAAVPRGARGRRRPRPARARERDRALGDRAASELASSPTCSTTSTTRCSPATAWLDSKLSAAAAPRPSRSRSQLEAAAAALAALGWMSGSPAALRSLAATAGARSSTAIRSASRVS